MLCGGAATAAASSLANAAALFSHATSASATTTTTETELTTKLTSATNTTASGVVNYETETSGTTTVTHITISVKGYTASSTLDITVNGGTSVAQIKTDASGNGVVRFSSSDSSLPTGLATLAVGDKINVGTDLTGALATGETHTGGGCDGGSSSNVTITRVGGKLADPANTAQTGFAVYKTINNNGTITTIFKVSVKGAKASSSLDVMVGDTLATAQVIGQINTDASGNGTLVLSTSPTGTQKMLDTTTFPTITAGTTQVWVDGTITGTINSITGHRHHHH
jgi:hypothetical protein